MRNAFAIILAGTALAACGQRGALYLPGEEQREKVGTTAPAAVPMASPIPAPAVDPDTENSRRNRAN